ncbi:hypothetical protein GCM10007388_07820 [Pseudoduganella plicata]|uniref:Uncharacterized protein n=1 Tax=Pseudoduganella plicata TaxID=321984 RepID=A0AA88CAE9_9BURK|nr:hypothetical protein GCM10007388_07820 [Pseudoduganella plicata]
MGEATAEAEGVAEAAGVAGTVAGVTDPAPAAGASVVLPGLVWVGVTEFIDRDFTTKAPARPVKPPELYVLYKT